MWHVAARHGALKSIPKHLITEETLSQPDKEGYTVWHIAALCNTIKAMPIHLFTEKVLKSKTNQGSTVWEITSKYDVKNIPNYLINEE